MLVLAGVLKADYFLELVDYLFESSNGWFTL
jgi:hypothetical protein